MFADPIGAALLLAIGVAIGAGVSLAVRFRPAGGGSRARAAGTEHAHRAADPPAQADVRADDLEDLNARLLSIINSAVDGIVVIDGRGLVESFNPGAERLFGYTQSEVVGRNVSLLMPAPYHDEHDGYLARYHATGKPKIIGIGREVRGQRKDGSTFPLHLSVGEMTIGGQRKFTGILHDLSERVRMEERLRAQASLATLGEMAAVIAHEVKNPLAGVRGAIQVIGGRLPAGSGDAPVVRDILARIDALDELMRDLLLFARPPQPRLAPVEVMSLLARTVDLLTRDPALRQVQVEIEGAAPPIHADAEMLRIVFHNLLANAAHAIRSEGSIRIGVRYAKAVCHVTFTDSGPGIAAELQEKIFVPFFTTKSRGSGLGLPTAKRLVEVHGGTITIASASTGTTVTVSLPVSPDTP